MTQTQMDDSKINFKTCWQQKKASEMYTDICIKTKISLHV